MKFFLEKTLKQFQDDLMTIFGDRLYDIILYGSAVTGDFIMGRGDLDILVLIHDGISTSDENKLYQLHDGYRLKNNLLSQLEGCYYEWDHHTIKSGVYIGTTRSGWKRVNHNIYSHLEQGMILQDYISLLSKANLNLIFKTDWKVIIKEITKANQEFYELAKTLNDMAFNIYAVQTSARNLYTLEHHRFTTKSNAMDYVQKKCDLHQHKANVLLMKGMRYPYLQEELQTFTQKNMLEILQIILTNK